MVPSTFNNSSSTNRRNEDILDRCELMKRGDLVPNRWCQAHKKTWYQMDGAKHRETWYWYLVNGAEHKEAWYYWMVLSIRRLGTLLMVLSKTK
jgi:hypothetical protein